MAFNKYCNVAWVGCSVSGTTPQGFIWLTATDGTFTNIQFSLPTAALNQMLALGIAAITTGKVVTAAGPNTAAMTVLTELFLNA